MQNTLTIAELKRRGMAAIEDGLKHGPVRVLKRNKSAAVVLSEAEYERLIAASHPHLQGLSAMQWLLAHAGTGHFTKAQIDQRLDDEREW